MELKRLEQPLTVCKVADISDIDVNDDFYFIGFAEVARDVTFVRFFAN